MTSADVHSKTVAKLLSLSFVFDPCFIMQYLVYLLFWQTSILADEESASCYSLIVFLQSCGCVRCFGLVCCVWLWYMYFLVRQSLFGHFIYMTIRIDQLFCVQIKNEPGHEISNNVVCATSKASDLPAQTRSLIRVFASRLSIL